jgi:hypothetical protein
VTERGERGHTEAPSGCYQLGFDTKEEASHAGERYFAGLKKA